MTIELFYVTHANKSEAQDLVNLVVTNSLAACGNIFPIDSCYLWKGQVENEQEWVSIIKTTTDKINELTAFIESHHSYEVPCILHFPVEVNEAYGNWVRSCVARIKS